MHLSWFPKASLPNYARYKVRNGLLFLAIFIVLCDTLFYIHQVTLTVYHIPDKLNRFNVSPKRKTKAIALQSWTQRLSLISHFCYVSVEQFQNLPYSYAALMVSSAYLDYEQIVNQLSTWNATQQLVLQLHCKQ